MKQSMKILWVLGILLFLFPSFAYGEEHTLTLRVHPQNLQLHEEITVELVATGLTNIAGADICINYDADKLVLILKKIEIDEGSMVDVQEESPDVNLLQDEEGTSKVIFGLKKNVPLINASEKVLATFTFKAIGTGQAFITLTDESQLIQEIAGENGVDYIFTHPQLPVDPLVVQITQSGTIRGRVSCSDGYTPAGAVVTLFQEEKVQGSAVVQEDGSYVLTNIGEGIHKISVQQPGYEILEQEITVTLSDMEVNFILQRVKPDADRNGGIELEDLVFVASRFGLQEGDLGWNSDADVHQDNVIDMLDILFISRELEE